MNFNLVTLKEGPSSEIVNDGYSLDRTGISSWLGKNNLMSVNEVLHSFHDISQWQRSGAESFICSFKFSSNAYVKVILIKALVTLSPEKSLADWARRRSVLSSIGIPVSNWYCWSNGLIVEDYYEKNSNYINYNSLLNIAFKIDSAGFNSMNFLSDIRSDSGDSPFYVDFGFDLGEPSLGRSISAKNALKERFPDKSSDIEIYYNNLINNCR